jgi:hypothetical protein
VLIVNCFMELTLMTLSSIHHSLIHDRNENKTFAIAQGLSHNKHAQLTRVAKARTRLLLEQTAVVHRSLNSRLANSCCPAAESLWNRQRSLAAQLKARLKLLTGKLCRFRQPGKKPCRKSLTKQVNSRLAAPSDATGSDTAAIGSSR